MDFNWWNLVNPEFYVQMGGIYLVMLIVFAETGLFAGFFLPGDSLLFVSGIYANELAQSLIYTGSSFLNVLLVASLIAISGILGNMLGYWFGEKGEYFLFERKENWFFRKKYLQQAHDFYEKHGARAIILARFLPIIRTFSPIVAGMVKMDKRHFMLYNVIGSVLWSFSIVFSGFYLHKYALNNWNIDLKENLEYIIIGLILVSTLPIVLRLLKKQKSELD